MDSHAKTAFYAKKAILYRNEICFDLLWIECLAPIIMKRFSTIPQFNVFAHLTKLIVASSKEATSTDPDQTPHKAASNQDQHCLQFLLKIAELRINRM